MVTDKFTIASLRRRAGLPTSEPSLQASNLPPDGLAARSILEELVNSRADEAVVNLVFGIDPSHDWADLAVLSHIRLENWDGAVRYFDFAVGNFDQRKTLAPKTMEIALVGLLEPLTGKPLAPRQGPSDDKEKFVNHIWADVKRRLRGLAAGNGIESNLDHSICTLAVQLMAWLGASEEATLPLQLITRSKKEFPLQLLDLFQLGHVPVTDEVIGKIRLDHPNSFLAAEQCARIEGVMLEKPNAAFESLMRVRHLAQRDEELLVFHELLRILAELSGIDENIEVARHLRGSVSYSDESIGSLAQVFQLIEDEDLQKASEILDTSFIEKDLGWLQAKSAFHLAKNELKPAAKLLYKAANMVSDWRLFVGAAELASGCEEWGLARESLEQAHKLNSNNADIQKNLAFVLERAGDAESLEILLREIVQEEPARIDYRESLARTRVALGRYEAAREALEVDSELLAQSLTSVLLRAELIRMTQDAADAYSFLKDFSTDFDKSKEFWFAILEASFAAGDDAGGNRALQSLLRLKEAGRVSDDDLWSRSIEDVKEYFEARREQHKRIAEYIGAGKIPWLSGSELETGSAWMSWMICTQPLRYLWDSPSKKIEFSVYASNSFTLEACDDGELVLGEIKASKPESAVVIDFSSLMTLTQLDLLSVAEDYFSEIHVPVAYTTLLVREARKLTPHQRTQRDSAIQVVEAISRKEITPLRSEEDVDSPILDPYNVFESENTFGFESLLTLLLENGLLDQSEYDSAQVLISHDNDQISANLAPPVNSRIVVEETALRMLFQHNLWRSVKVSFEVCLKSIDLHELSSQVATFQALEKIRSANADLAQWIGSSKVKKSAVPHEYSMKVASDLAHKAYELARHLDLPLLADDRVWHALRANERGQGIKIAFDTASLLNKLQVTSMISDQEYSAAYLKLLKWRYKFLIVPADVLFIYALEYQKGLPGESLRNVGRYIHECASDSAMFGGLEKVSPPTSMAARWAVSWVNEVARFLVMIWLDERIADDQAGEATVWSARCLLPSMIASLNPAQRIVFQEKLPSLALTHFTIEAASQESTERVHRGFQLFAKGLGIDKEAAEELVEDLVRRAVIDAE